MIFFSLKIYDMKICCAILILNIANLFFNIFLKDAIYFFLDRTYVTRDRMILVSTSGIYSKLRQSAGAGVTTRRIRSDSTG